MVTRRVVVKGSKDSRLLIEVGHRDKIRKIRLFIMNNKGVSLADIIREFGFDVKTVHSCLWKLFLLYPGDYVGGFKRWSGNKREYLIMYVGGEKS